MTRYAKARSSNLRPKAPGWYMISECNAFKAGPCDTEREARKAFREATRVPGTDDHYVVFAASCFYRAPCGPSCHCGCNKIG